MLDRTRIGWMVCVLALLSVAPASGQLTVCDGRNHLNNATTGTWGLPAARTLGVRFTPASQVVVERIEWLYAVSPLSPTLGGTVSIILEAGSGLPSTNPADVLDQAQWNNPAASGWDGGTFNNPVVLQAGVNYWLTTTAAPVVSHQVPTYDDAGPDPTTYAIATSGSWVLVSTPHRFKVRVLATVCSLPVEYQVNQVESSADVNGMTGSSSTPAVVVVPIGQPATANVASTLTGASWDVLFGLGPLVPASGGGITLSDGQILNVNLLDPTLSSLFTPIFNGPPFADLSIPLGTSSPFAVSFQMGVADVTSPTGVRLSQPNRLMVQ